MLLSPHTRHLLIIYSLNYLYNRFQPVLYTKICHYFIQINILTENLTEVKTVSSRREFMI